LTGIRERTNTQPRSKKERRLSNNWAFYQLRQFIEYKAIGAGVRVVLIPPAYTSKTCHKCNHIHPNPDQSYRHGKYFRCGHCLWTGDADLNASMNIQQWGVTVSAGRTIVFILPCTACKDRLKAFRIVPVLRSVLGSLLAQVKLGQ